MIYVTHDQIEAMTLADRIILMREGRIEQQGAPLDLYEQPATLFVAGFLGSPQMNLLHGRLVRSSGGTAIHFGEGEEPLDIPNGRTLSPVPDGAEVILGLRPEHAGRAIGGETPEGAARVEATIELLQPTGSRSYATFRLFGQPVLAELHAHDVSRPGECIAIDLDLRRAVVFDRQTGKAL